MRIFVKRENWEDGIWMRLPATKEEAEQVRRSLEEQHPSVMLPFIGAVDSNFPELENRLVGEIVFPAKNLGRLNQMAERLRSLNGEEEMLFQAAFRLEAPYTAEQILETLGHLDRYRLHPEIGNLEELGRYLSQKETSQLPEGLEVYVDYTGIGRLQQEDRGYLTEGGYVEKRKDLVEHTDAGEGQNREKESETEKRQETEKMEKKQGVFSVTLIRESFKDRYVRFALPLPEQELAEKKRQAGITEEIPERVEIFTSIDGLLEHLPPGSTLEELNQAARVIEEMETCSGIDWKLTFAALEAELPGTMEECCRIIQNHQTYELLPFPFLVPESYAHYYLEQEGFSIPEGLKDHFDYRRFGQEKIRETGAVETFYGVVVNREHPICLDHGERQELKLYSPLTLTTFAGYPLFPALLHGEKMPAFQTVIRKEIAKSMREYGAGGLAETLYNQLLSGKISSIVPDVEEHQGQLWGVAQICTKGELTEQELSGLKKEWKEIAAHGWGDLFAGRTLNAGNIRFHARFWDTERGENLSLMTEEEFGREVGGFEIRM